jgi:hypothetical protein
MFLLWTVVLTDILPAALTAGLIFAANRWRRTPRAFHAWSRTLAILGAQLIVIAVLMAMLLIAIFCYPNVSDPRPIPLMAYIAALLWCGGPAASGMALRAAARSLDRRADAVAVPREIEAFS